MKKQFDDFTSFVNCLAFLVLISSVVSIPLLVAYVYTSGSLAVSIAKAASWVIVLPYFLSLITQVINEVIFENRV